MSEQMDMFSATDTAAHVLLEPTIATDTGAHVAHAKLNVMARFLAGIMFPGAGKYENLSAAKRKTAERAAQAAADVFTNHTEEGKDG